MTPDRPAVMPGQNQRVFGIPVTTQWTMATAIIVPFLGLIAAMILTWGWGLDWTALALFAGMYFLTLLGITVGFHRLLTHRSFETYGAIKALFVVLGSMSAQGHVLKWVAFHRRHHQMSDQEDDPHTPHHQGQGFWASVRGVWFAHTGWLFEPTPPDLNRYVGDLLRSRLVCVLSSLTWLWILLGLLIPTILGGLLLQSWTGALQGFMWGGLVRIFAVHHVTFSVNSVCHLWGARPYETDDQSRNNALVGILALGEGWHNNHHAFPLSARHGLAWWQVDISWLVIRSLSVMRLAWDVRLPDSASISSRHSSPTT
jgi:stearoyl-CoA desaturase (delta-9 desaturase)